MSDAIGIGAVLQEGYETLSGDQTVPFTQYIRYVLPLDGYVFWLATQQTTISGSLHVAVNKRQNEDETISVNQVVFTTSQEIAVFNEINPQTIWVGCWRGLKFAFSNRGFFYEAAGLYHYSGEAVYPAMESQLVDVGSQLPAGTLVVSNSLPAWLAIKTYTPVWLDPLNPAITLYPSFAVPDNLRPPYGTVHIAPELTQGLQMAPWLAQKTSSHFQLARDHVKVTFYGLINNQAQDWLDTVHDYSMNINAIGFMDTIPIMRDEKRTQVGLDILAMKKTVEFDVAYNQARINDIARQLIVTANASVIPVPPNL